MIYKYYYNTYEKKIRCYAYKNKIKKMLGMYDNFSETDVASSNKIPAMKEEFKYITEQKIKGWHKV